MSQKIKKISLKVYDDKTNSWVVLYPQTSADLVSGQVKDSLMLNGKTSDKYMSSVFDDICRILTSDSKSQGISAGKLLISNDYKNDEIKVKNNQLYVKGEAFIKNGKSVATAEDLNNMSTSIINSVNNSKVQNSLSADKLSGSPKINNIIFNGTQDITVPLYTISSTEPTDTSKLWIKTDGTLNYFYNSKWLPIVGVFADDANTTTNGGSGSSSDNTVTTTITIKPTDWSDKTFSISNESIKETSLILLSLPDNSSTENTQACELANIDCKSQTTGNIILYCMGTVPTTEITLEISIINSSSDASASLNSNGTFNNASLIGKPTAPTVPVANNSTQLATTEYVHNIVENYNTIININNVITVNIAVNDWDNNLSYTVNNSLIKEKSVILLSMDDTSSNENITACSLARIKCSSQSDGSLILTCSGIKPTINVSLVLNIINHEIQNSSKAATAISNTQDKIAIKGSTTVTASRDITEDDIGKIIICYSSTPITLTLPTSTSLPWMRFSLYNRGTANVSVTGGTIFSSNGVNKTLVLSRYQCVTLQCSSQCEWVVMSSVNPYVTIPGKDMPSGNIWIE